MKQMLHRRFHPSRSLCGEREGKAPGGVMDRGPLTERLVQEFDGMSAQLQSAARYVLERPNDVALLSMREQARQAGVQPATMTRLAQRLGLDGYETVRTLYAEAIREAGLGFAGKAGVQVASQKAKGDEALAAEIVRSTTRQIEGFSDPAVIATLVAAAALLTGGQRIYRSEEHTSELQSLMRISYAVFCLKKKKKSK